MIVGKVPTWIKLDKESEESHQVSVIPGKRQKNHDVWSHFGRTGVSLFRFALGYMQRTPCAKHRNQYLTKTASACVPN